MEKATLEELLNRLKSGERAVLATVIEVGDSTPGRVGSMMVVFEGGSTLGTVGGGGIEYRTIAESRQAIQHGKSKLLEFNLEEDGSNSEVYCGGKSKVFLKVFNGKPKLLIVGAGHVAYEVYQLAKNLSYDIHIFDNRETLCNKERFGQANLSLGRVFENLKDFKIDEDTYIVIAGPSHRQDEDSLEAVIGSSARYIGMLGSKKKVDLIKANLLSRGVARESLDRLRAPIGIDVGSSEPSELALGIMAEISMVKNSL